jgi:hypothetical protein
MPKKIRVGFCIGSLAFTLNLFGQINNETRLLINSPERPSMLAVRDRVGQLGFDQGIPLSLGTGATFIDKRLDVRKWTETLMARSAEILPIFESIYPNAIWVFIGRDSAALADVFDAFYLHHGQNGRVIRLGVSKKSFGDITDAKLIAYLKALGVSINLATPDKPFIFVDSISSGGGRQVRHILSVLYTQMLREHSGSDFSTLPKLINMLGMRVSTTGSVVTTNHWNVTNAHLTLSSFLSRIPANQTDEQIRALIYENFPIVALEEAPNYANEAGYTHFIGAWNQSYGAFGTSNQPARGEVFHEYLRQSVLWTQQHIWQQIDSGKFSKLVKSHAKQIDHDFEKLFKVQSCNSAFSH